MRLKAESEAEFIDGLQAEFDYWGWEHQMHFDVPEETVADVIEQASGSPYWTFDIPDDELLERFVEAL